MKVAEVAKKSLTDSKKSEAKWFTYRQNNSYGKWVGPFQIIVQAKDSEEADRIAEGHGAYFDRPDCPCCGSRWSNAWGDGESKKPSFKEIAQYCDYGLYDGLEIVFVPLKGEVTKKIIKVSK